MSAYPEHLTIDRSEKIMTVPDRSESGVRRIPVGIGRGGLKKKTSMADYVTPTGSFTVDIILTEDPALNRISEDLRERYRSTPRYHEIVKDASGLSRLFDNMLSIDFDGDGAPDRAYGAAYVGLHSDTAVTGPKMRTLNDTLYWFSIALHGTPNEASNIGAMNSGGCVHVPRSELLDLIRSGAIEIGTRVEIHD